MANKVIHKHVVDMRNLPTELILPVDSNVVHVAMQDGNVTLWEEHGTPVHDSRSRFYEAYITGSRIPYNSKFIGTVFSDPFVWHLYELK